jgi:iron-sulfur cluster assembly protein
MISVTDIAAAKIQSHLARRGRGLGIRVGVKTTGCSGLAYVLEFVDQEQGTQICTRHFDTNGVRVYVNPEHLVYLDGMTIDYQKRGLNEGFEFINDKERDRCGCGESFRV